MLNRISWSSFIWTLILLLVVYYLYVLVKYFRKDFSARRLSNNISASKKQLVRNNAIAEQDESGKTVSDNEERLEQTFSVVHELLEDIKQLFLRASRNKMIKEELVQAIQLKLRHYPAIQDSDLKEDINMHVVLEAKEKCMMEILPEDLKRIWNA